MGKMIQSLIVACFDGLKFGVHKYLHVWSTEKPAGARYVFFERCDECIYFARTGCLASGTAHLGGMKLISRLAGWYMVMLADCWTQ